MVAAVVVFILFIVSTMSDYESSSGTPATVSVHTTASNQAGNIHRPSLPQVKPPPPLNLADWSAKRWKLWWQTWLNFAIVSKFSTQGEAYQKALFLCTIGQSALENQRISVHCERRFKQAGYRGGGRGRVSFTEGSTPFRAAHPGSCASRPLATSTP